MKLNFTLNDDGNSYSLTSYEIEKGRDNSTVVIPSTVEGKPVTSIGRRAFQSCTILKNITIPDSVMYIGHSAFAYCRDLSGIVLPNHITSINDFTFEHCISLTSITIPDSVTSIGSCAFSGCTSLTNVTLGNSVTSIGTGAFESCCSLASITIPNSVVSIGQYAFCYCDSLIRNGKFKATNANLTCRDYKFTIGKFSDKEDAKLCESGYHYCKNAFDLFNYYYGEIGGDVRFFEVKTRGESNKKIDDSKRVCKRVKLVREIKSYAELLNGKGEEK